MAAAHPLADYLAASGDDAAAFAARLGAGAGEIEALLSGEPTTDIALARRIVAATDGAVSFADLFGAGEGGIADLGARRGVEEIDRVRLAAALSEAVAAIDARLASLGEALSLAAEAAAETHAALAGLTTRRGASRLAQALRPVLREIPEDFPAFSLAPDRMDEAADLAAALYCRAP